MMKRAFLVLCLICVGAVAFAQEAAAPAATAMGVDNLHVETGAGLMTIEGEDSTGLLYGAVNYGFPVSDIVRMGGQVGAKLALRDDDPDWLVSAGVFQRDVPLGVSKAAWAVQGIYQNTWAKADLLSLKPTFGVEIDEYDYVALTGVWGLNDENTRYGVQQPVDQALLFWGAEWSESFRTELGGGYVFQDVDSMLVAAHVGYALDSVTTLNCTGAFDMDGNYYTAVSLGFDLGGGGRNATFNNVTGGESYTPFPLGSLPVMFYETQEADCAPVLGPA
jgi:hypothetical protein